MDLDDAQFEQARQWLQEKGTPRVCGACQVDAGWILHKEVSFISVTHERGWYVLTTQCRNCANVRFHNSAAMRLNFGREERTEHVRLDRTGEC